MIEKKSDKGNLEKRKTSFLLIGFAVVLALTYVSFELFASRDKGTVMALDDDEFIEVMDEDVIATDQTPPPPPPPVAQQQEVVLNIVEDNIKVNTDFDFSQDFDENLEIEEYVPIEIVEEEAEEAPVVRFAEKMPEFPGGTEAMYSFLQKELTYPEVARNNGIQGTVLLEFVVERDGSVSNVKPVVSLFPECDAEAIRVVKKMPKWKPGEQLGKPVRCYFNIPIRFTLQ
ncbi:MAG: energy transducer TonB [Bacteroidales bacterium]|jgi:protein TonB|nr:energy transducer TonB [Bacteroidota bacterium]MBQ9509726.1 energy transducer TonB [Bacteroidales bacterium]MBR6064572.1 energy transducer TonB [Bacteroidales bacterium]